MAQNTCISQPYLPSVFFLFESTATETGTSTLEELLEATSGLGSGLAAKRREYILNICCTNRSNGMCQHLQVVPADVAREQAKLAREQAKADVAIAADKRAIVATQTTTEVTTDVPLLDLQSSPAMPVLHADISMQSTPAELPAQQKQSFYTSGRLFCQGDSIAATWKEWKYDGDCGSVKSWRNEDKSGSCRLALHGSRRGTIQQSERSKLSKMLHLPQAIDALTDRGVPEHEALRQIDELLLNFGLKDMSKV